MNIFVFDIETIPDTQLGRKLHNLTDLDDQHVAAAMLQLRRSQTGGSEFLPPHKHQVVAISVVFRQGENVKIWSLGENTSPEAELIQRFFDGVDRFSPTLVSWNGSGFDLPVIHYRALLHGIVAPRYWEIGDDDNNFRWNNYLNRFHYRHMDIMDILAGYQNRANAPLDEIATLLGFPGKLGMSGAKVWDYYQQGNISAIRDYCESDVLNTYLIFLRLQLIRGKLTKHQYDNECQLLANTLQNDNKPIYQEFLRNWQQATT